MVSICPSTLPFASRMGIASPICMFDLLVTGFASRCKSRARGNAARALLCSAPGRRLRGLWLDYPPANRNTTKEGAAMIYETRTYDLKPRSLPEVEQRFGEAY